MQIGEVAELAGFSRATVSRVLNGGEGVSDSTVQRVQDAIDRLGYTRAHTRRGRRTKRLAGFKHRTVALLMVRTDATMLHAPVGGSVLNVVESELADIGVNMIVSRIGDSGRLPAAVLDDRVDGLLLLGHRPDAALAAVIAKCPSVWLLSQRDASGYVGSRVSPDNDKVGDLAACYLIEQGYRSLVYLDTEPGHVGFADRRAAFQRAAADAGVYCEIVASDLPTGSQVTHLASEQLEPLVERMLRSVSGPTGIFVPRDPTMVLVHRLLQQKHDATLCAGEFGLISCDNDPVLAGLNPLPATIDLNTAVIAREAVGLLADRINGLTTEGVRQQVYIEPSLVLPQGQPTYVGPMD